MNLKGSKTEQNLLTAFAGESQAGTKYGYYAAKARKEGYQQIGAIFEETAHNERQHAKIWYKLLNNGIPDLEECLEDAASGERYEWTEMYANFEKEAREEGFEKIADLFAGVAKIEKEHVKRYRAFLKKMASAVGFAVIAGICTLERARRRFVRYVHILKRISN